MPKKSLRTPSYRLHRPSGQARVIIDGTHIYLGKYDSPESWEKYHRTVAEWLAGRTKPSTKPPIQIEPPTINSLILAFWQHVKKRYVKNGKPTSEQKSFRAVLRPLYGRALVTEFGHLALGTPLSDSVGNVF